MTHRRTLLPAALAVGAALLLPATAGAATATVTGDDGQAIALSDQPTQIRNLSPVVALAFGSGETHYSIAVTAPDGSSANLGPVCLRTASYEPEKVRYLGNVRYTVTVRTGNGNCNGRTLVTSFQVQASTSIPAPNGKLITRRPGSSDFIGHDIPVAGNPGAVDVEVRYARNATLGPDGGIAGSSNLALHQPGSDGFSVKFFEPGTYTFVSRAVGYGGTATPWSAPVKVRVVSPFDFLISPYFTDSRGPSYAIKGTVRERATRGKITVRIAKGRKGGKFRKLRTVKINRQGGFTLRFTQRRTGVYRLRYVFKGSATTAPGYVQHAISIKRVRF